MPQIKRNGKKTGQRSMSARVTDAKCAWRNMDPEHRKLFVQWCQDNAEEFPVAK